MNETERANRSSFRRGRASRSQQVPSEDPEIDSEVLAYLSFTSGDNLSVGDAAENVQGYSSRSSQSARWNDASGSVASMQGVLWKRRDIFRNRWRPRWFVLHPEQRILSYYLLNESRPSSSHQATSQHSAPSDDTGGNRRRADSEVSLDTIDYDVVPRGSIYLGSCTVEANEALTRPEEHLYALTITDHETATHCHLAARNSTARDRWIDQMQRVVSLAALPTTNNEHELHEEALLAQSRSRGQLNSAPLQESATGVQDVAASSEWSTVPSSQLLEGVPSDLVNNIEALLQTHLPYANTPAHPDWTPGYRTSGGVWVSKHKTSSAMMIRSIYPIQSNRLYPVDYHRLMWDLPRVVEFETNVRVQKRLKAYNPHTSLVYTAYHQVWPTSPREFATVAHWRLIRFGESSTPALVGLAFSCPQAESLGTTAEFHVRGTLHVAMNVFQLSGADDRWVHTRFLSYDLKGRIPQPLMQAVLEQQASIPVLLERHLQKGIESSERGSSSTYQMNYECLVQVQNEAASASASQNDENQSQRRTLEHRTSVFVPSPWDDERNRENKPSGTRGIEVNAWMESLVLLTPLLLRYAGDLLPTSAMTTVFLHGWIFVGVSVICLRWVLLQHLSYQYIVCHSVYSTETSSDASRTTCRISVDLQGTLRCLNNEKLAERNDSRNTSGKAPTKDGGGMDVEHVVLRSLAVSMRNHLEILAVSRNFPILSLFSMPTFQSLDIVYWTDGLDDDHLRNNPVWVHPPMQQSTSAIAEYLTQHDSQQYSATWLQSLMGPGCKVIYRAMPIPPKGVSISTSSEALASSRSPISVIFWRESELLQDDTKKRKGFRRNLPTPHERLIVSLSFQSTNEVACRDFARVLQQSIECPEMLCDI